MATAKIVPAPLTRPLSYIAGDIQMDYAKKGKPVYFAAVPYVNALLRMDTTDLSAKFYDDGAEDIVIRLLGNLSTWRGETATRVRNELKAALADHQKKKGANAALRRSAYSGYGDR